MRMLTTLDELEAIYGFPNDNATVKEVRRIVPEYRDLIAASPFAILATSGPEGLDCSPRGDRPGFVRVHDETTLLLPDRRGNNRIDSLRNIVRDPRCALLFLIPGVGTTLRVNGSAQITVEPPITDSFAVDDQRPRSVIVMTVESAYFQCARALIRSDLWNAEHHRDPATLPSPGRILTTLSNDRIGGEPYDREWPERAKHSLW